MGLARHFGYPQSIAAPSVTIFGLNYAPEPTGISPYTTGLAERLAAGGHQVSVVVAHPHYPSWELRPEDQRARARRSSENGVDVTRLWVRMPRPMNGSQRLLFELSYFAQAITRSTHHSDVIVGVIPGLSSGLAAALHARRRRCRLTIVLQDLIGQGLQQSGMQSRKAIAQSAQRVEGWVLRQADRVIAISEAFVEPLVALGVDRDRITVLPNWCRVASSTVEPAFATCDGRIVVLHSGSMGLKQGLRQILEAAELALGRGLPITFRFVGDGSERDSLERAAARLTNVEFRDPVAEDEFPAVLASADVLLVSQAKSNVDMSFPSKLTSYFAAGRPVVAAVPSEGSVARFLRSTGAGLACPAGDPEALLDAIRSAATDHQARNGLLAAAADHLERHWSAEEQLERWYSWILYDRAPARLEVNLEPKMQAIA